MKSLFKKALLVVPAALQLVTINAQSLSEKAALTALSLWKDSLAAQPGKPAEWNFNQGVLLEGIDAVWQRTADGKYFHYIQHSIDHFVEKDGSVRTYKPEESAIDAVKNGRSLLTLYKVTGDQKYLKAATVLWQQLKAQPRSREGLFWHSNHLTGQLFPDDQYMAGPFYAEYASLVHDQKAFDDIASQFIYAESHLRNPQTGLLYHGWDEAKTEKWADKTTGNSPSFWGRAMAWYGMALVDVLDFFPENHPRRRELLGILTRFADAAKKYQDPGSGLWYNILDKPQAKGNYHEASASGMFVYSLAKGVRKAYLPSSFFAVAQKGFAGIQKEFVAAGASGLIEFKGTIASAGLGGNPYRDGTYEYYTSIKTGTNDPKGLGVLMLAASEMERAALPKTGRGKTVTLDNYFNREYYREAATGQMEPFHYLWTERDNNGFYFLNNAFNDAGITTKMLEEAPSASNLSKTDIYLIVDPDSRKETASPNYVQPGHIRSIAGWVKEGGVLVLFGNDSANCELPHFNKLAEAFGIHFNDALSNHVVGDEFEMGAIYISPGNDIFKSARKLYMKDIAALKISNPARARLTKNNEVIIATAKYGKGTVFAVGDPWLYNEYTDGRKLSTDFENYKAAEDLVRWLVLQVPAKK